MTQVVEVADGLLQLEIVKMNMWEEGLMYEKQHGHKSMPKISLMFIQNCTWNTGLRRNRFFSKLAFAKENFVSLTAFFQILKYFQSLYKRKIFSLLRSPNN